MDENRLHILTSLISMSFGASVGWLLRGRRCTNYPRFKLVSPAQTSSHFKNDDYKLVLVVRNDLNMGKGKVAAQCCHGSVLAYCQSLEMNPIALKRWEHSGQAKVVLRTKDEKSLLKLAEEAKNLGLIVSIVSDAGRTQVPSGCNTVIGIGPGPEKLVNQVTCHLKLL